MAAAVEQMEATSDAAEAETAGARVPANETEARVAMLSVAALRVAEMAVVMVAGGGDGSDGNPGGIDGGMDGVASDGTTAEMVLVRAAIRCGRW